MSSLQPVEMFDNLKMELLPTLSNNFQPSFELISSTIGSFSTKQSDFCCWGVGPASFVKFFTWQSRFILLLSLSRFLWEFHVKISVWSLNVWYVLSIFGLSFGFLCMFGFHISDCTVHNDSTEPGTISRAKW